MKEKFKRFNQMLGRSGRWVLLLMIIILTASLFASLIQNSWGTVTIETVYLDTRDNQTLAYDIYIPNGVSETNKAPVIIEIAGFQRSRETQGHVALEFARRGFVVINIDPYSQGDSSSSSGVQGTAIATYEGYGAFDLIDYIYDNDDVYPFIDKDRIGVTGHSAGGNAAYQAAIYFGKDAVNNGGVSKVHSVFISGYVLSIQSDIAYSKSNMGMDYALYDEGAFRNEVNTDAPEDEFTKSNAVWMIETCDFINSGLSQQGLENISYNSPVEVGKIYGNPTLKNMRQVFNTETIHAFQPYSIEATSNTIRFFEVAMDFTNPTISATNQVWMYKEILTTITLIASLAMIVPLASLLYRIPFFKSSKRDPIIIHEKRSRKRLIVYLVVFVISASFAALTYLPSSKLTLTLFADASASVPTWFFPQRMTNAVMVWAVFSGLFSAMMFILSHLIFMKNKNDDINKGIGFKQEVKRWGISIPFKDVLKTLLLGLIVACTYFIILMFIYGLFHVDYRFIFVMAARRVNFRVILQALMYDPLFFIFYFSNSIRVNGSQMHGKLSEGWKMLIASLMNITGLAIILLIQYVVFASTGTIAFTELADGTTQWLYINILFTLLPVMFLMPLFNRWFYKLSGNSYLGPVVITIIFIVMALSNSVAYIPN